MTDAPEAPAWLHRVHELGSSDRLRGVWPSPEPGARESAVLILFGPTDGAMAGLESLDEQGGGVDVVLTQRADAMRTHAGQVSFPGGGVEHDDADAVATALREAHEEIGLSPAGVEVLGALAPVALTVTNFAVTPVLAWWQQPSPVAALDPIEVAHVARVRVSDLIDPANRHTATHPRGFAGPAFTVDGLYVWGFTAFLLDAVLTAARLTRAWNTDDRRQVPQRFLR